MKRILYLLLMLCSLYSTEAQHLSIRARIQGTGVFVPPPPPSTDTLYVYWKFGQSNAEGYGESATLIAPYNTLPTNVAVWNPYTNQTEPLSYSETGYANNGGGRKPNDSALLSPGVNRFGFEMSLLKRVAANHDTAYYGYHMKGGTPMYLTGDANTWNAARSDGLTAQLIVKMKALKAKLQARFPTRFIKQHLLFGQGESDAWVNRTTAQYLADLNAMYTLICNEIGQANIPIVIMQIHSLNGGQGHNDWIQAAQQQFVAANTATRSIFSIDSFTRRDDYHFYGETYIYGGEQAAKFFDKITFTNVPTIHPNGYIHFRTPYPWIITGPNTYIGSVGTSDAPAIVNGVGGVVSNIFQEQYFGLRSAQNSGAIVFKIEKPNDASTTFNVLYNGVVQTTIPIDNGKHFGFKVSTTGTIQVVKSSTGIYGSWTPIYTYSQNGSGNWWVELGHTFLNVWEGVQKQPL